MEKTPNHLRQVTFQEDINKMVNHQRKKVTANGQADNGIQDITANGEAEDVIQGISTKKENGDVIQKIIWNEDDEELMGIQDVFG